jgi:hypothetical protein
MDNEALERMKMARSPRLQAILDAAEKRMDAGEGILEKEFWEAVESEQAKKKRGNRRRKTA